MKKIRLLLVLAFVVGATTACDFFESLASTTQGVALITRTPDLANAIPDSNLRAALTSGGALAEIDSGATGVFVGLGQRSDPWAVEEPTPVEGADVLVSFGSTQIAVCETGEEPGTYAASSVAEHDCGDPMLSYVENETYTTEVTFPEFSGWLEVTVPPAINPSDVTFSPALAAPADFYGATLPSHTRGLDLTVDWSANATASERPAILNVLHVEFTGFGPADALQAANWSVGNNPVHTDAPDTPRELIDIVLLGENATSAEIPGSVFNSRGLYFVVLTSTELSEDKDSFSVGSGTLAGVGTVWSFWVQ